MMINLIDSLHHHDVNHTMNKWELINKRELTSRGSERIHKLLQIMIMQCIMSFGNETKTNNSERASLGKMNGAYVIYKMASMNP